MEISDAWVPTVTHLEVEQTGILLDDKFNPQPDNNKEKIFCKLYYLKSKDLFVTIADRFVDTLYATSLHIITSELQIRACKFNYFKEELSKSVNDAFTELDESKYAGFETEITANYIKTNGRFLEKNTYNEDYIYYLEEFDIFISFNPTTDVFERIPEFKTQYRKKYNIPYQDERFETMVIN